MPTHRRVSTNGIVMHVAQERVGAPVVLCHGFPELCHSWRHPLPALADSGFGALAVDMRGLGETSAGRCRSGS